MLRSVYPGIACAMLSAVAVGCGSVVLDAPADEDTLAFEQPGLEVDDPELAEADGPRRNFKTALRAIRAVSRNIEDSLYWPRQFLSALARERPRHVANGLEWSHTLLHKGWQITLAATEDARFSEQRNLQLTVSGFWQAQLEIQDFVWMTGIEVRDETGRHGTWTIADPEEGQGAPSLMVTWAEGADGARSFLATNVSGQPETSGDQLRFSAGAGRSEILVQDARPNGDGNGNNSRNAHAPPPAEGASFRVVWNSVLQAGSWQDASGQTACWAEATAKHVDMPCPPGEWPPSGAAPPQPVLP